MSRSQSATIVLPFKTIKGKPISGSLEFLSKLTQPVVLRVTPPQIADPKFNCEIVGSVPLLIDLGMITNPDVIGAVATLVSEQKTFGILIDTMTPETVIGTAIAVLQSSGVELICGRTTSLQEEETHETVVHDVLGIFADHFNIGGIAGVSEVVRRVPEEASSRVLFCDGVDTTITSTDPRGDGHHMTLHEVEEHGVTHIQPVLPVMCADLTDYMNHVNAVVGDVRRAASRTTTASREEAPAPSGGSGGSSGSLPSGGGRVECRSVVEAWGRIGRHHHRRHTW